LRNILFSPGGERWKWVGEQVRLRNRVDGFDVEDVVVLVQRAGDANLFSKKAFHVPGVGQEVGGAVDCLFQEKSAIFLRNLSREGADVLLVLLLCGALQFITVLILLGILFLLLTLSFLRVARSRHA